MITLIGAALAGLVAGAVGTLAMDLVWFSRYKRGGGQSGFLAWEFSSGLDSWDSAPAPAQVGKLIYQTVGRREPPGSWAAFTNNFVHWSYGIFWGGLYGLVAPSLAFPTLALGLVFGLVVWVSGYIVLPPLKVYKPMWEYDAGTLWQDLSAHFVFGLAAAVALRVLLLI